MFKPTSYQQTNNEWGDKIYLQQKSEIRGPVSKVAGRVHVHSEKLKAKIIII